MYLSTAKNPKVGSTITANKTGFLSKELLEYFTVSLLSLIRCYLNIFRALVETKASSDRLGSEAKSMPHDIVVTSF